MVNAHITVPTPIPITLWKDIKERIIVKPKHIKSNLVFIILYGVFNITDKSLGNISVGVMGNPQLFANVIPTAIKRKLIIKYIILKNNVSGISARIILNVSRLFPKIIPIQNETI